MSASSARFVVPLSGLLCLGALAGAGDQAPIKKTPAGIRSIDIANCSIKLLDDVVLSSDRGGVIGRLDVREGDAVRERDLVVLLKDEVARAALATAEREADSDIEIRYAEKAAEVARAEYDKALDANRRVEGTVPAVEVRRLKLAAEKSTLEIESARYRHDLNGLKRDETAVQVQTFRVEAPFDGIVTRVHRAKGESVRQGDPILELSNTRRVRVEGYIALRDTWGVSAGQEVRVRLDLPDVDLPVEKEIFPGRVVFVDVKAAPVTGGVRVWAEVENADNVLRAGLTARMQILADSESAAK